MKRWTKLLILLLSVALVCASLALVIGAEDTLTYTYTTAEGTASTDDYATASANVSAGGTITLNKDVEITSALGIPDGVTFNLGGKKLTSTGGGDVFQVPTGGTVTVAGSGKIVADGRIATVDGTLTIDGSEGYGIFAEVATANASNPTGVMVSGGYTFNATRFYLTTSAKDGASVQPYGIYVQGNAILNMTSSYVRALNGSALCVGGSSTNISVSKSTVSGVNGIYSASATGTNSFTDSVINGSSYAVYRTDSANSWTVQLYGSSVIQVEPGALGVTYNAGIRLNSSDSKILTRGATLLVAGTTSNVAGALGCASGVTPRADAQVADTFVFDPVGDPEFPWVRNGTQTGNFASTSANTFTEGAYAEMLGYVYTDEYTASYDGTVNGAEVRVMNFKLKTSAGLATFDSAYTWRNISSVGSQSGYVSTITIGENTLKFNGVTKSITPGTEYDVTMVSFMSNTTTGKLVSTLYLDGVLVSTRTEQKTQLLGGLGGFRMNSGKTANVAGLVSVTDATSVSFSELINGSTDPLDYVDADFKKLTESDDITVNTVPYADLNEALEASVDLGTVVELNADIGDVSVTVPGSWLVTNGYSFNNTNTALLTDTYTDAAGNVVYNFSDACIVNWNWGDEQAVTAAAVGSVPTAPEVDVPDIFIDNNNVYTFLGWSATEVDTSLAKDEYDAAVAALDDVGSYAAIADSEACGTRNYYAVYEFSVSYKWVSVTNKGAGTIEGYGDTWTELNTYISNTDSRSGNVLVTLYDDLYHSGDTSGTGLLNKSFYLDMNGKTIDLSSNASEWFQTRSGGYGGIYSSKPGAVWNSYKTNDDGSVTGTPIFNVHVGGGLEILGENITFNCAHLVRMTARRSTANQIALTINGGTYNQVGEGSYNGFIVLRDGQGINTFDISNATFNSDNPNNSIIAIEYSRATAIKYSASSGYYWESGNPSIVAQSSISNCTFNSPIKDGKVADAIWVKPNPNNTVYDMGQTVDPEEAAATLPGWEEYGCSVSDKGTGIVVPAKMMMDLTITNSSFNGGITANGANIILGENTSIGNYATAPAGEWSGSADGGLWLEAGYKLAAINNVQGEENYTTALAADTKDESITFNGIDGNEIEAQTFTYLADADVFLPINYNAVTVPSVDLTRLTLAHDGTWTLSEGVATPGVAASAKISAGEVLVNSSLTSVTGLHVYIPVGMAGLDMANSDSLFDFVNVVTYNDAEYWCATKSVASNRAAEKNSFVIAFAEEYNGTTYNATRTLTLSVADYVATLLTDSETDAVTEKNRTLAYYMLTYIEAAYAYMDTTYGSFEYSELLATYKDSYGDLTRGSYETSAADLAGLASIAVDLQASPTWVFTSISSDVTKITVNGITVYDAAEGVKTEASFNDLRIYNFDEAIAIEMTTSEGVKTGTYCLDKYIATLGTADEELNNLTNALYNYILSAKAFD